MRVGMAGRLAAVLLIAWMAPSSAHHSVAGQFDIHTMVTVSGVVAKVDWVNPHIYLHVDAKDAEGQVARWRLEGGPVAMMRKAGLSKAILEGQGETVTIYAFPARDGTPHLGFIQKITYPDGRFYQFTADTSKN